MSNRLASYLFGTILLVLGVLCGTSPLIAQNGFSRDDILNYLIQPDVNDIIVFDGRVYLSANGYNDQYGRWTQHLACFDTTGVMIYSSELVDTIHGGHLISDLPTRLTKTADGGVAMVFKIFNNNTLGIGRWNAEGDLVFFEELPNEEPFIRGTGIYELMGDFYISGVVQRSNYNLDVFIMKVNRYGLFQWIRIFGEPNEDEWTYGALVSSDGMIKIGSKSEPFNWSANPPFNDYWRQPWLITVDTSGHVINEWKGEKSHTDEMSAYGLARPWDGSYSFIYNEFHEVQPGKILYRLTTALLDSTMQVKWKRHYGDLVTLGTFVDNAYSSFDSTIVLSGFIGWEDQLKGLIVKYDMEGNEIWAVRPTSIAEHPAVRHYIAGIDIAPSGSIYAAGYIEDARAGSSTTKYGWLIKVTADGCIDTLCTTTSIEEQIAARQGWQVVFPNPVRDEIRIILPEADPQPMTMTVFDMQGRIVDRFQVAERQQSFKVDWQPGMYGYQLHHKGAPVYVGKLVKME